MKSSQFLVIESSDTKFLTKLIDVLNSMKAESGSTILRLLDEKSSNVSIKNGKFIYEEENDQKSDAKSSVCCKKKSQDICPTKEN